MPRIPEPLPAPEEGAPATTPRNLGSGSLTDQRLKKGLRPGQMDPEIGELGHRQRELAGRRSYLRNFWYAVGACLSPP
jgi:hypothetical protein